jgi:hypothetical protein
MGQGESTCAAPPLAWFSAFCACEGSAKVTKPNPRGRPVSRSVTICDSVVERCALRRREMRGASSKEREMGRAGGMGWRRGRYNVRERRERLACARTRGVSKKSRGGGGRGGGGSGGGNIKRKLRQPGLGRGRGRRRRRLQPATRPEPEQNLKMCFHMRGEGRGHKWRVFFLFASSVSSHLAFGDLTAESKGGTKTLLVGVEAEVAHHDPVARLWQEGSGDMSWVSPRDRREGKGAVSLLSLSSTLPRKEAEKTKMMGDLFIFTRLKNNNKPSIRAVFGGGGKGDHWTHHGWRLSVGTSLRACPRALVL